MPVITAISRPSFDLIRKLSAYDFAPVHEVYGGKVTFDSGFKPLDPQMKVCGPARLSQPDPAIILSSIRRFMSPPKATFWLFPPESMWKQALEAKS